ncbi:MAG: LptF/LptG family permease [Candidatus Omnitrophica bacterium]|nr:LptF/LptG family permease [Candidatus Omnitrophota bacterium]
MKILRNYILSEFLKAFIVSLAVFTFVMLAGNLAKIMDMIINKGVEVFYVLKLLLFLIPYLLSYTISMATLCATLLVFGKLSSDNEITAMKASGLSLYKIATPVLIVGLIVSVYSLYLNDRLVPKAHLETRKTMRDIGLKSPSAYIEAGTFIRSFEDYIIFIYEINGNRLKNIRIYEPQKDKPTRTIVARRGEFIPIPEKRIVKLKLIDGTTEEPVPNDPANFYKLDFRTYYMTLNLEDPKKTSGNIKKKTKDMTFRELKTEMKEVKDEGILDVDPILTRIHKKIAISFSSLAFILIGLPLAVRTHRSEKSIGFGISLVVLITYWLLLATGNVCAINKILPPWLAMWLGNIIFMAGGIILLYRTAKR